MYLLYIQHSPPDLSQTFVRDQMRFLRRRGHSVGIMCGSSNQPKAELVVQDYFDQFIILPQQTWTQKIVWKLRSKMRSPTGQVGRHMPHAMSLQVREGSKRPDALIAHFGANVVLAAQLKRQLRENIPLIGILHGSDLSRRVKKRGLNDYVEQCKFIDRYIVISEHWAELLRLGGIPKEKIRMLHLGVENPSSNITGRSKREEFVILSVGRLVEKKGFDVLIDAFDLLPETLLNRSELHIVGDGPLHQSISERASKSPYYERIFLSGSLPHQEVLRRIGEASVFALASRTSSDGDMEGIPVVLMEAMAIGTPVVSTFHSGIPELIKHKVNGLLTRPGDPVELARALKNTALDTESTEARAIAARQHVQLNFNNEIQNRLFEKEVVDVVTNAQRGST